ncbi:hypothetical protein BHM03_00019471 [Ensete ventricosum]|uniref:Uncharacterized protein n=1 Tax=Ensete ventricosum TaxID=4639 RepID=A0A427AER9_ENSVE|nr:hypothetical protein B296_00011640 [Ensete ventricosum]RZR91360.1 hypothetical protein BHM03_00019471 [Ensete ventricosum]
MTAMKKRASPPALWLGLQLILWLSVLACTLALIGIGSRSPPPAALVEVPFSGTAKIACLFLARSNLPLDFLWHAFFQASLSSNICFFSRFLSFVRFNFAFDVLCRMPKRINTRYTSTRSRALYSIGRRRDRRSFSGVVWGEVTMIEAERLLIAAALKDPANRRFALISDRYCEFLELRLRMVTDRFCAFEAPSMTLVYL